MVIKKDIYKRLLDLAGSTKFFKIIVGILVVEAAWIALSGRYAMAFDEDFHLGIIRLYADHLSPFWSGPPAGGGAYGAVARDPSYLYHYLMSFPYRVFDFFNASQTVQVILLRAINIGLFAWGLTLYRSLLLKTGASRAIVNVCLLIFILVPVAPLLAAQVNYDNLILPLTALALITTLRLVAKKARAAFDVKSALQLLLICLAASLVKYAFLPIFAVIAIAVAVKLLRDYQSFKDFRDAVATGWQSMGKWAALGLIAGLLLFGSLFIERYGVNVLRYHKPIADCGEVLDYEHCQYYGPWIRDYNSATSKGAVNRNPAAYTQHWTYGLWFRSFFAVDGPATQFQTRGPLVVPSASFIVLAAVAAAAFVLTCRRLWKYYKQPALWLFTATISVYLSALWLEDYKLFLKTGQPVAINGRYLLPIVPLLLLLAAISLNCLLAKYPRSKVYLTGVIILCFLWGGGALTYVLRSNDNWYWPNTPFKTANHALQRGLGPITPGYRNPTQFLH